MLAVFAQLPLRIFVALLMDPAAEAEAVDLVGLTHARGSVLSDVSKKLLIMLVPRLDQWFPGPPPQRLQPLLPFQTKGALVTGRPLDYGPGTEFVPVRLDVRLSGYREFRVVLRRRIDVWERKRHAPRPVE